MNSLSYECAWRKLNLLKIAISEVFFKIIESTLEIILFTKELRIARNHLYCTFHLPRQPKQKPRSRFSFLGFIFLECLKVKHIFLQLLQKLLVFVKTARVVRLHQLRAFPNLFDESGYELQQPGMPCKV